MFQPNTDLDSCWNRVAFDFKLLTFERGHGLKGQPTAISWTMKHEKRNFPAKQQGQHKAQELERNTQKPTSESGKSEQV